MHVWSQAPNIVHRTTRWTKERKQKTWTTHQLPQQSKIRTTERESVVRLKEMKRLLSQFIRKQKKKTEQEKKTMWDGDDDENV